jgi:hypothetical protein
MLAQKFVEKARDELREDDTRKEQALKHFREWIAKHPFIKNIRQGRKKFPKIPELCYGNSTIWSS